MDTQVETPEQIRTRILDAAQRRFEHYGYNKTTMAELAKDCKMSAANLYRYFENKLDIGAHLTRGSFGEEEARLRQVVARKELSGAERLREFVLESLRHTYRVAQRPRVDEMVEAICKEHTGVLEQNRAIRHRLLVALIAEANASGEFDVEDPATAAEGILAATVLFKYPPFVRDHPLEHFERRARIVTDLMLQGLLKR
jgi:AcrR family transcriptional regulator